MDRMRPRLRNQNQTAIISNWLEVRSLLYTSPHRPEGCLGLCVLQSVRFSDLLSVFRGPVLPTPCLSLSLSKARSSDGPLSSTFPLTQTWDQFSRQERWRFE